MNGFQNTDNPVKCKEHPLQNILILDKVFGHEQSAKAVLRNRLVCRIWHEINFQRWLEIPTFPVLCYHPQSVSNISQKPLMDLAEFSTHFKMGHPKITRMLNTPPSGIELHAWELVSSDLSLHDLDSWFWSLTITSCLTKLTLTNCRFTLPAWIYQEHFLEKLDNLQSLTIKNGIIHPTYNKRLAATEPQNLSRGYSLSRLRNLEISVIFSSHMKTPPDLEFNLWINKLRFLNKLQITLSDYPQEFPTKLVRALDYLVKQDCLVNIDLLDFSKKADEISSEISFDADFKNLEYVAVDLGFMPERRCRKIKSLRKVVLYRAPFHETFPSRLTCSVVHELELWGNVAPDMELQFFKHISRSHSLKKFVWNTRCYDDQHRGKRIQHLLNDKQKAYSLFTYDLVKRATKLQDFDCLFHLDIDFGPLSKESWARLGQRVKNLMTLKAVLGKDHDLLLVSQLWPKLMVLELKHRSRVSITALIKILPNLTKLRKFFWKGCACTSAFFTKVNLLKEMENVAHALWKNNTVLPWSWNGDKLVQEKICLEAEFENKLLGASNISDYEQ